MHSLGLLALVVLWLITMAVLVEECRREIREKIERDRRSE
jgi:hypothetical protein